MREPWVIGAAGAALGLALVGLVAFEGQARARGLEVALAMEAIDPRGLLTGHYAALELGESLPAGAPCPPGTERGPPTGPFEGRARGWVALRRAGSDWRVAGMADSRAGALRLGEAALRGGAECRGGRVELDIGIARFHADQGEAEALERLLRASRPDGGPRTHALVSVGRDGRARLKGVRIDGRRVELDWL